MMMNISRELDLARKCLEEASQDKEIERSNLLSIREQLWDVQMALKERTAEKDAKLNRLRQLRIENEASLTAQKCIHKDIEKMRNHDSSGSSEMDLVDVDTFKRDNPDCPVDEKDENLFMMERFKDEQNRRAKLFSRRMELNRQIQELELKVKTLRDGTNEVRLKDKFRNLVGTFRNLDDFLYHE